MTDHVTDITSLTLAAALLGLCLTIGAWDVWVAFGPTGGRTVSSIIYAWGQQFPPLVLGVGLLLGHLFWPVHGGPGK